MPIVYIVFMLYTGAMFTLKALPWAENAFEPVISQKTISFHYHKHHAGYVNKLNELLGDKELSMEEVLKEYVDNPAIWNNAAQHFNHEFYWESLSPNPHPPQAQLHALIEQKYCSFDSFKTEFISKCITLFGSGWLWLTFDGTKLYLEQTSNAALPNHKPLLVMDVWEHAYYLDYQNKRIDHVERVFQYLDWQRAEQRLQALQQS